MDLSVGKTPTHKQGSRAGAREQQLQLGKTRSQKPVWPVNFPPNQTDSGVTQLHLQLGFTAAILPLARTPMIRLSPPMSFVPLLCSTCVLLTTELEKIPKGSVVPLT